MNRINNDKVFDKISEKRTLLKTEEEEKRSYYNMIGPMLLLGELLRDILESDVEKKEGENPARL